MKFPSSLWPWQQFSNWGATKNGREDGRQNKPDWDTKQFPQYINELQNVATREINSVSFIKPLFSVEEGKFKGDLNANIISNDLHAEFTRNNHSLSADATVNVKERDKEWIVTDGTNGYIVLNEENRLNIYKYNRANVVEAEKQVDKANDQLTIDKKSLQDSILEGKPLPAPLIKTSCWYAILIILLCICEIPMNAIVFRALRIPDILTYGVAVGIAVILVFCAHCLGDLLKKKELDDLLKPNKREWDTTKRVFAIICVIIPMLIIAVVTAYRELFISIDTDRTKDFMIYFIFYIFNLIIFFTAMICSYRHHSLSLVYNVYKSKEKVLSAQKEVERVKRKDGITENEIRISNEISKSKVERIKSIAEALRNNYWSENLRIRPDRTIKMSPGFYRPISSTIKMKI